MLIFYYFVKPAMDFYTKNFLLSSIVIKLDSYIYN